MVIPAWAVTSLQLQNRTCFGLLARIGCRFRENMQQRHLADPKGGFGSDTQVQQWLSETLNIAAE